MSDDRPFASENPFRSLDKRRFRSKADAARKDAPASGKGGKTSAKANATQEETDFSSMLWSQYQSGSAQTGSAQTDATTFLSAVAGATPLGAAKTAKSRSKLPFTPALENPVLPPETTKLAPHKGRAQAESLPEKTPGTNNSQMTSSQPDKGNAVEKNAASPLVPDGESEDLVFASAMRDVSPLAGKGRDIPPEVIPQPVPVLPEESNPLQDFMDGKLEFALASTDEYVEGHIVGLDLMTVGKLQAGQYSPESHLDLHGMNAVQAFQSLVGFIKGAYLKGQRAVLVVPGRGLNSPQGMPVLRAKVQDWFTQEPFRRVVLAFCTAKTTDGGAGALYVLLRKFRKDRGKVYWERKPADPDLL